MSEGTQEAIGRPELHAIGRALSTSLPQRMPPDIPYDYPVNMYTTPSQFPGRHLARRTLCSHIPISYEPLRCACIDACIASLQTRKHGKDADCSANGAKAMIVNFSRGIDHEGVVLVEGLTMPSSFFPKCDESCVDSSPESDSSSQVSHR